MDNHKSKARVILCETWSYERKSVYFSSLIHSFKKYNYNIKVSK